ncbi:unnamed protein product [Auanema sp. JU1783]|nr:unnamed protein product [Auanema sp. JU1783]
MEDVDAADLALLEGPPGVLSGDVNENELLDNISEQKPVKVEEEDLYDDAIAPSTNDVKPSVADVKSSVPVNQPQHSVAPVVSSDKKFCCYVGNMTWWTTDADLALHVANLQVNDLIEMKFFENRTNGQSKGFASCTFGSEQSVKIITEKLPQKLIHGNTLCVLPFTKQSLNKLDEAAAKVQNRPDAKNAKKEDGCVNMGTIRIGGNVPSQMMRSGGAPPMHNMMMGPGNMSSMGNPAPMNRGPQPLIMNGQPPIQPLQPNVIRPMGGPGVAPGVARPLMNPNGPQPIIPNGPMGMQVPPGVGMQMQQRPPGMPYQPGPQPLMQQTIRPPGVGQMPPPGAHVNPQMFPGMQANVVSEAEFEDIMHRLRTVSSSAITRAQVDAGTGHFASAIETLRTALTIVRTSRISGDERCQPLFMTLDETISDIEKKSRGRNKHRDRDRSRSRSRDRDRKRRRRSRTRSRSPRGRGHRY